MLATGDLQQIQRPENSENLVLVDGDISKNETAVKVAEAAIKNFGRIGVLINNAGISDPKPFTDYTEDDFEQMLHTNVASFFYMTQQVIPQMRIATFVTGEDLQVDGGAHAGKWN